MKNALLLLLFILALSSCTIEKRRYFKGYHVTRSTGSGTAHSTGSGTARSTGSGTGEMRKRESEKVGPFDRLRDRGNGEVGKREGVLGEQCAESEAQKPQRGDIIIDENITAIDKSNTGVTTPDSDTPKPQRGDIVITSPADITTANSPLPIQNTSRVMGHKKSHALEGLGAIFLIGIITVVIVVGLIIFLLSDSAIAGLIGGLLVGLIAAIGIYLLLISLFIVLLFLIISSFGS